MPKRFPLVFTFAILILLVIALFCFLNPRTIFGAFWTPWVIGAAVAWAVGRFLDELWARFKTS